MIISRKANHVGLLASQSTQLYTGRCARASTVSGPPRGPSARQAPQSPLEHPAVAAKIGGADQLGPATSK